MHCNDTELLSYVDGELSIVRKFRVQRHLDRCWQCRTRLSDTEQQIRKLTREVEDWNFPPAGWLTQNKLRLNAGMRDVEARMALLQDRRVPLWRAPRTGWTFAAAAGALVLTFVLFSPEQSKSRKPVPVEEIGRALAVENRLFAPAVQQTLSVEIAELRPAKKNRTTRLDVWADRRSGRFASKWLDREGAVKHAVWRAGSDSEIIYSPVVSGGLLSRNRHRDTPALPLDSLSEFGLDAAQIERAFLRWLESRAGQPVSFTSDLAVWSHQDGTVLAAELLERTDARPVIRVTAERRSNRVTAVLNVEFNANDYRPRLQTIRFETPERAIEFRMAATRIQPIAASELKNSLFVPDLPIPKPFAASTEIPTRNIFASTEGFLRPELESSPQERQNLEAHFVLHQAGACLGEPVKIDQREDGIHISNRARGSLGQSFTSVVSLDVVLSAFAELREGPPLISELPEGADAEHGIRTALEHAWALSRVARRFPAAKTAKLPPEQWRLLEVMIRDHLTILDSELERFHGQKIELHGAPFKRGWREASIMVFETLLNVRELLKDEPMAKVAPLLVDADAELHGIALDFSSESSKSQVAALKHLR